MLGEAKIVFKNRRSLCGAGISEAGAAETDGGKIGSAGCALLLGGFDGLHKGHETLLAAAKQTGLKVAAIAITGGKGAPIYTEAERDYIFARNGISAVYPLEFRAIRDMSAAEFACAVRDEIAPEVCFCGEDFRFGSGGKANGDDFARLSGVSVRVLPVLKDAATGEKIGAEHIKALLKNGDVSAADKLLCGGFILTGEVKKDRGIGATIGFPTANIFYPEGKTELKKGVYETRAEVGGVTYKGITNFGSRPTFGNDTVVTETHLIGFRGNLYGKTLTVRFVRYLRDVAAFKNAEELTARLHADVKRVEEGK